jgi:hypothetical protein
MTDPYVRAVDEDNAGLRDEVTPEARDAPDARWENLPGEHPAWRSHGRAYAPDFDEADCFFG